MSLRSHIGLVVRVTAMGVRDAMGRECDANPEAHVDRATARLAAMRGAARAGAVTDPARRKRWGLVQYRA